MRIALIGHGWIATKMAHALRGKHQVVQILSHENCFDYLDAREPRSPVDWVVNCAGVTGTPNVDACEKQKAKTIDGNTLFPIKLMQTCLRWQTRLAHFSSGCIFSGGPFSEDDPPNFDGSVYSATKLVSDVALLKHALVLRIRMPFDGSDHPKNLLTKLRRYAATGKVLDGYNSLTHADEACAAAAKLIAEGAPNGPYHLVNDGGIWTHEIMHKLGLAPQFWDKAEFAKTFPAPRSECVLVSRTPLSEIHECLERTILQMKVAA